MCSAAHDRRPRRTTHLSKIGLAEIKWNLVSGFKTRRNRKFIGRDKRAANFKPEQLDDRFCKSLRVSGAPKNKEKKLWK